MPRGLRSARRRPDAAHRGCASPLDAARRLSPGRGGRRLRGGSRARSTSWRRACAGFAGCAMRPRGARARRELRRALSSEIVAAHSAARGGALAWTRGALVVTDDQSPRRRPVRSTHANLRRHLGPGLRRGSRAHAVVMGFIGATADGARPRSAATARTIPPIVGAASALDHRDLDGRDGHPDGRSVGGAGGS